MDEPLDRGALRWSGLCLDCRDAEEMACFYGDLFGWQVVNRDDASTRAGGSGWILMSGPEGGPTIAFQAEPWYEAPTWPEAQGAQTKMMHLEVIVDDVDAAVQLVESVGGRIAPNQPADRDPQRLRVMLDPAGHPFCLFRK
jgi:catechol 2,3-dioxygenase-like lactoylglutathione lyase family enzyme